MSTQPPAPPPPPGDGGAMPPPPSGSAAGAAADLGVRFGARVIDFIIFYIVFIILALVVIIPLFLADSAGITDALGAGGMGGGTFISGIISLILVFAFYVFFDTRMGGTPGKLILNLKVHGAEGGNPTPAESVKRNIWLALSIIPIIGGLLQLAASIYIAVTISRSDRNVGWHDTFAGGTAVVRE